MFQRNLAEKVEWLTYVPNVKTSNDLEAGTKTITATSEASGLGNADYSVSLTLPAPTDSRLAVKRIGERLAVTIDSLSTGASLRCRVYVDSQDANHLLFDETWAAAGAQLDAHMCYVGLRDAVFTAITDGAAHTYYFYFWKTAEGTGNTIISLVAIYFVLWSLA
jgi:hypothetical protein